MIDKYVKDGFILEDRFGETCLIGLTDEFKATNPKMVTIPEGIKEIGIYAFSGCENLKSITIPEGVTKIESFAFYGCTNLSNIIIPEGVTKIGNGAFYGCKNLTSVTIPEGVTEIGYSAFKECSNLTEIRIPIGSQLDTQELKNQLPPGCEITFYDPAMETRNENKVANAASHGNDDGFGV